MLTIQQIAAIYYALQCDADEDHPDGATAAQSDGNTAAEIDENYTRYLVGKRLLEQHQPTASELHAILDNHPLPEEDINAQSIQRRPRLLDS